MDSLQQQLQQVQKAILRGQLDYAGRVLDQLRQTHASTAKVWLLSAAWYRAVGDKTEALDALAQAATMSLIEPALRTNVVDAYLSMQAWSPALKLLQQMDPEGQRLAVSLARCEWGLGRYQIAIDRLQKFVISAPQDNEAQVSLWQCFERFGHFSEADKQRQYCQRWTTVDPIAAIMENTFLMADDQWDAAKQLLQTCQSNIGTIHTGLQRSLRLIDQLQHPEQPLENIDVQSSGPINHLNNARKQASLSADQTSLQWLQKHSQTPFFGSSVRLLMHAFKTAAQHFTPDDWYLEFGVYYGRSLDILARSQLSQNLHWHGFDSFTGPPKDAFPAQTMGNYSTDTQQPIMPDNVSLHPGWFSDTLPAFINKNSTASAAFIHLDCDYYSSTQTVLDALLKRCQPGTVIQFNTLIGYPDYQQHQWHAWQEFIQAWPSGYNLLGAVFMGRAVAVQLK